MPELPQVGDEFVGYRLRAVLGRGGMSTVYEAENPRLANVIALKVLAPELATDDAFRARFLEESRIAASMSHPNVIPIHDTGSSDGLLYIAMRYVCGTDLRQMISKRGRLQPESAVALLSQAARALDAAHRRGLVHRDVKPANLLVEQGSDDSDPDHLYLADFGITKTASGRAGLVFHGSRPATGQFVGTVDYVAPEQIQGLSLLGPADQYSLGCVLYECLTGRVPFEKDLNEAIMRAHVEEQPARPTLLRPDLPDEIDEVFSRVLAKQPGDRYEDCRAFMTAARDALDMPDMMAADPSGDRPLSPPAADYWEVAHDPGGTGLAEAGRRPGRSAELRPTSDGALGQQPHPGTEHPEEEPDPGAGHPDEMPYPGTEHLDEQAYLDEAPYRERAPGGPGGFQGPRNPGGVGGPGRHGGPGGLSDPGGYEGYDGFGGPGGFGGDGGRPAPGRYERDRDLRIPLLILAAAVLIAAAAGVGTAIGLSGRGSPAAAAGPAPSQSPAAAVTPAPAPAPASSAPGASAPTASAAPLSALEAALLPVQNFTGRLRLANCKTPSATFVTCSNPDPEGAIASATFQTLPSLTALYAAYQAEVAGMAGKPFGQVENTQNCGSAAPKPMGEISWNHSDQHTSQYSVAQIASGTVANDLVAGRMFCVQLANGGENIIWTENYGKLLVIARGQVSHEQVWLWFVSVHHNVAFAGQPAMPGMAMPEPAPSAKPPGMKKPAR